MSIRCRSLQKYGAQRVCTLRPAWPTKAAATRINFHPALLRPLIEHLAELSKLCPPFGARVFDPAF